MAFEVCRRQIESDIRTGWRPDDPHMARSMVAAVWAGRYGRRRGVIEGAHGSAGIADRALADRLAMRWRARDAALAGQPGWPADIAERLAMTYRHLGSIGQLDVATPQAPHAHGPSFRALWLEAEKAGADEAGCLAAIEAWSRRPLGPAPAKASEKRVAPYLARPVPWTETDDPDQPWAAEVDGQAWLVQLNDFPEEPPYTLLVAGKSVGSLLDWPETWHRGADASEAASAPAPAAIILPERPEAWPARYEAGEHEAVWAEMVACGPRIREAPFAAPAEAVARETMRRVRRNIEILLPRLAAAGYVFGLPDAPRGELRMMMGGQVMGLGDMLSAAGQMDPSRLPKELQGAFGRLLGSLGQMAGATPKAKARPADPLKDADVFSPPDRGAARILAKFARRGLPLPLSLRFWIEEVGRVDLTGRHPVLAPPAREGGPLPDPLSIIPDSDDIADQLEGRDREDEPEPLILCYSPADKSAPDVQQTEWEDGMAMPIPNAGADAPLVGGAEHPGLVPYLRRALRQGGFPGWEGHPERPAAEIAALSEGMLAF
ncbi:hypothetical protein [Falsiroseomonas sp. HW251]|uniref:hypothetical protein n=1 Tax=Falsiroseomonas sp. HW251 TaxID=3390998 RepID=UPI003D316251